MGNSSEARVVAFTFHWNEDVQRGVLNGSVTAALRRRREAEPGDIIRATSLSLDLVVDEVIPGRIGVLLQKWHREMGFRSYWEAARDWEAAHPYTPTERAGFIYRFHLSPFPLGHAARELATRSEAVTHAGV